MDFITYSCPDLNSGLATLCQWRTLLAIKRHGINHVIYVYKATVHVKYHHFSARRFIMLSLLTCKYTREITFPSNVQIIQASEIWRKWILVYMSNILLIVWDCGQLDCNSLCRPRKKENLKLRMTGPCEGNPLVTCEFPQQSISRGKHFPVTTSGPNGVVSY